MTKHTFPLHPFLTSLASTGFTINIRDYRRIARALSHSGEWNLRRLQRVLRSLLVCNTEQQQRFDQHFNDYFYTDLTDNSADIDIHQWQQEISTLLTELESAQPNQKYNHPYSNS